MSLMSPASGEQQLSVQCIVGTMMMHMAHDMKLAAVDLNLLVALKALLGERHVTRAARQLGLSQSATSHALARLRELYGDPLLVRSGRTLELTPRAVALLPQIERGLGELAGEPQRASSASSRAARASRCASARPTTRRPC